MKLPSRLSWSCISSFEYDKEQWARRYLDRIVDPQTPEMAFGNVIDTRLQTDMDFLPEVPRLKEFQKKLGANFALSSKTSIELIGYLDAFQISKDKKKATLGEYKTSSNDTRWTQKTSQEHGQILFYLLLIYLNYQILPENVDVFLAYVPVKKEESSDFSVEMSLDVREDNPVQVFKFKHTTEDVLKFGHKIQKVYREMEIFAESYPQAV